MGNQQSVITGMKYSKYDISSDIPLAMNECGTSSPSCTFYTREADQTNCQYGSDGAKIDQSRKLTTLETCALKGHDFVHSIKDTSKVLNKFLIDNRIVAATSIVTSMIKAESYAEKFAHMAALCNLYETPESTERLCGFIQEMEFLGASALSALGLTTTPGQVTERQDEMTTEHRRAIDAVAGVFEQSDGADCDIKIDLDKQETIWGKAWDALEKQTGPIKILIAVAVLIATQFGFKGTIGLLDIAGGPQNLATLANEIKNTKTVWEAMGTACDNVLSMLAQMAGRTYIPPKMKRVKTIADNINALYTQTQNYVDRMNFDSLGVIKDQSVEKFTAKYNECNKAFIALTHEEKTLYNWNTLLFQTQANIQLIRERRNALLATQSKQEPTRVWIYGEAGVGKTVLCKRLISALGKVSVYSRNARDAFWSKYAMQDVCYYDDLGQYADGIDITEWHQHASSNATAIIGAALEDKGLCFRSRYMIASSNFMDVTKTDQVAIPESFNRRRDILIWMHVPGAVEELRSKGRVSEHTFKTVEPEYYLLKPVGKSGEQVPVTATNYKTHPRVIGRITFPEIVAMMEHSELRYRETYRRFLLTQKEAGMLADFVTVPTEPFHFRPEYLNLDYYANPDRKPITRPRQPPPGKSLYGYDAPEAVATSLTQPDEPHVQPGTSQDTTTTSSDEDLLINLTDPDESDVDPQSSTLPVSVRSFAKKYGILLEGPPGVGKTVIIENIASTYANVKRITSTDDPLEVMNQLEDYTGIVIVDDFTVNEAFTALFSTIVQRYHAGGLPKLAAVIGTCNPGMPSYNGDMANMIRRRCLAYAIEPVMALKLKMTMKPLVELLRNATPEQREKKLRVCRVPGAGKNADPMPRLSALAADIKGYIDYEEGDESVLVWEETIIPMPDEYTYYIRVEPEAFSGALDFKKCMTLATVTRQDGSKVPLLEIASQATKSFGLMDPHKFSSNWASATSAFNSAGYKCQLGGTWIVDTQTDMWGVFGFSDTGEDDDHTIMFKVETGAPYKIVLNSEGIPFLNNERLQKAHNEKVTKMYQRLYRPAMALPSTEIKDLCETKIRLTPAYQFVHAMMEILSTVGRCAAIGVLLNSMIPRKKNAEQPVAQDAVTTEAKEVATVDERAAKPVGTRTRIEDPTSHKFTAKRGVLEPQLEAKKMSPFMAYEHTTGGAKQRRLHITEESYVDGAVVINEAGEYGVRDKDRIVYLKERGTGTWRCAVAIDSKEWKTVVETDLPSELSTPKGKNAYTLKWRKQFSPSYLNDWITKTQIETKHRGRDLGSIFAFAMVYGIPYDVAYEVLAPDALAEVITAMEVRVPPAFSALCKRIFPSTLTELTTTVKKEGMIDPQQRTQNELIWNNMVSVVLNGVHHVHAVMLRDNYGLTVAHCSLDAQVHDHRTDKFYPIIQVAKNLSNDIMIFKIVDVTMQAWPKVTQHIISRDDLANAWQETGHLPISLVMSERFNPSKVRKLFTTYGSMSPGIITVNRDYTGKSASYSAQLHQMHITTGFTQAGDCGGVVTVLNPTIPHKWCGIHRAGNSVTSVCAIITREWVEKAIETGKFEAVQQESSVDVPLPPDVEPHSFYDEETGLQCIGKLPQPIHIPTETRIRRTGLFVEEYSGVEPAILSKFDPRADGRDLYIEGIRRYGVKTTTNIDKEEWVSAMKHIGNELANMMNIRRKTVRKFTKTEAINRPPYSDYPMAKPLDRTGSAGFPHVLRTGSANKGDYLTFNEGDQKWYFSKTPEAQRISSRITQMCLDAEKDVEHFVPFIAYPKDECVPLRKIYSVEKKTRIFFSGPFEYLVAYRMYFGAAMQRVMEMHGEIPVKVGISSTQESWNQLGYSLSRVSADNGMATDVKNYDSSIMKEVIESIIHVYNTIYSRCSLSTEDWQTGNIARQTLHRAVEGATIIVRDKILKLEQAMVSGCPSTAIDNSFVIWALYYIVWRRLALKFNVPAATYTCFRQNVALAIYGDDNVATVAPGFEWFNFNSFREEAAKMGFTITDALKLGKDVPDYLPLEKLDFLKRGFIKQGSFYKGPLDKQSIGKSMHWMHYGPSYSVTPRELESWPQIDNCDFISAGLDANWPEIALANTEEEYNRLRDTLLQQMAKLGGEINPPLYADALAQRGYRF